VSLFEWIGESVDPGEVGTVRLDGPDERPPRSRLEVAVRLIVSGLMLAGLVWLLHKFGLRRPDHWAIAIGVTAAYLCLGYFVRPEPDWDNIGWLGGMMNHPFRYSDNINRTLLTFKILLWPGAFVSEAIVDAPILFGGGEETRAAGRREKRRKREKQRETQDLLAGYDDPPPEPKRFKPRRDPNRRERRSSPSGHELGPIPLADDDAPSQARPAPRTPPSRSSSTGTGSTRSTFRPRGNNESSRRRDQPVDPRADEADDSEPTDRPLPKRRRPGSNPGGSVFEPYRET
jgi:hypothetical protein